jgi:hypothetical protein
MEIRKIDQIIDITVDGVDYECNVSITMCYKYKDYFDYTWQIDIKIWSVRTYDEINDEDIAMEYEDIEGGLRAKISKEVSKEINTNYEYYWEKAK